MRASRRFGPRSPAWGGKLPADARVPSRVVMDVLGHSQIAVTLNTYTHVMPSLIDEAADAMDCALGSGLTK